jgi:hypothetical protein
MTERKRRKQKIAEWRHRFSRSSSPMEKLVTRAGARFYVTVRDGARTGFLLGPYASHMMALVNRARGEKLAHDNNDRAIWYAYGTSSALGPSLKTVFGR